MLDTAYKFKRIFSGVMKFLLKSTYLKMFTYEHS